MLQLNDYSTEYFTIELLSDEVRDDGVRFVSVHAADRYGRPRHLLERRVFMGVVNQMERYLRRRPHKTPESRRNIARSIIYASPAIRAWAQYMPGGFATYHVHNPEHKRLASGKKVDYLAKNMFRHSVDGQGLRSRAYAMTWLLHQRYVSRKNLSWVSVAAGTGQPTYDARRLFAGTSVKLTLIDTDARALTFARQLAADYDIPEQQITFHELNVVDERPKLTKLLRQTKPQIIEAMGLFEYLTKNEAIQLLRSLYSSLKRGGSLVFTNMRPSHPHLHTHQRGLGWPGVKQRDVSEVLAIIQAAGLPLRQTTVALPDDDVYAVYGVLAT